MMRGVELVALCDGEERRVVGPGTWEVEQNDWLPLLGALNTDRPRLGKRGENKKMTNTSGKKNFRKIEKSKARTQ